MLNDEMMILKIRNCKFGEGPNFLAKEVFYLHECKKNYLHEKYKSSDIRDFTLERLLSYVRNKIFVENKHNLASLLLELYKINMLLKVKMKTWLPIVLRIYVFCYDYAFLWRLKQKTTKQYFKKRETWRMMRHFAW